MDLILFLEGGQNWEELIFIVAPYRSVISSSPLADRLCPAGQLYQNCSEGDDGLMSGSGVACERTCESYLLNLTCSTHEPCVAGCTCPPGWVTAFTERLFCLSLNCGVWRFYQWNGLKEHIRISLLWGALFSLWSQLCLLWLWSSFYASAPAIALVEVFGLSVRASHSRERDISGTPWGNLPKTLKVNFTVTS